MAHLTKKDRATLQSLEVKLVILFGSARTGPSHPGSDVDIGLVFRGRPQQARPVHLYGSLQEIFSRLFPNAPLDIVYLEEAPLGLQFRAVQAGELLYSSSAAEAADYKERVTKLYLDFAPVEQEFRRAIVYGQ